MEQNDNRESQRAMAIVCLPFVVLRQLRPLFFFFSQEKSHFLLNQIQGDLSIRVMDRYGWLFGVESV